MGLFKSSKKVGVADVIRCDASDHLIWKWHPDGTESGEGKREYAIRFGSKLRVREGEVAVFAYKQKGKVYNDYIVGPTEETLHTKNLPVIGAIVDAFFGKDTPFQADIYFINTAKNVQVKFGVPYFDVCDERFPDFAVPVAVRGSINFKIDDYKEFVKIYRLEDFTLSDFSAKI
ncbi:MAG: SPFH domain-containing protein, partial [Clostridia bacterium]|nr:SPFH domain-containing protein [Clostridia bacterium]